MTYAFDKSDEQWRAELDPEQYAVLREAATERAVDRRAARREPRRPLCVRRLRRRAVPERHEVRLALRMAELLRVDPP